MCERANYYEARSPVIKNENRKNAFYDLKNETCSWFTFAQCFEHILSHIHDFPSIFPFNFSVTMNHLDWASKIMNIIQFYTKF